MPEPAVEQYRVTGGDADGDGKADLRRHVLTGFGTEDSHHALHDIVWTPDGDLMARESIFHHSQVEPAYGPIRLANSGWFRYRPSTPRGASPLMTGDSTWLVFRSLPPPSMP